VHECVFVRNYGNILPAFVEANEVKKKLLMLEEKKLAKASDPR
jgi:hypothetical protein